MARPYFRYIPLGGIGEIGKNCNLIEHRGDLLMIDAGVKFPEEEMHGVDLIIPDITTVIERLDRLRGIVLTHGHEDHIGGLPFLLQQMGRRVPVFGSRLTLGLVEAKLRERRAEQLAALHAIGDDDVIRLGPFEIGCFHVSHSVPDSLGIVVKTAAGTLVHSGDFKLEGPPQPGTATNFAKIEVLGRTGVRVLLCDTTRVEEPGFTPPESAVFDALEQIMASAPGRVILTTFASNITRLQQAILIAARHGRKVGVAGRSLETNLQIAADLGFLTIPHGVLVPLAETKHLPLDRVLLLTTGSQGEPTSVLARMAVDDYPAIRVRPGDTVILSATAIPGNEETVGRTIDNLFRRGANVIWGTRRERVHVSGHGSQDDLKLMLSLLRPEFCVPVHGEYRMMVLFQRLAVGEGIQAGNILLPEIGDVLEFGPGVGRRVGRVSSGSVLVDGITVGAVSQVVLRDRRRLAEDGIIVVSMALDRETGRLVAGPDLLARGFIHPDGMALFEEGRARIVKALKKRPRGETEYGYVVGKIKDVLGAYIYGETHKRPLIVPVVTEV